MESTSSPRLSVSDAEADSGSPSSALKAKYPWVTHEMLMCRSLMTEVDLNQLGSSGSSGCTLTPPDEDEPICANQEPGSYPFFFFYREYISRLGVRFPFTEFQMSVLQFLHLAPSQLHPNGWGYLIAFELLCNSMEPVIPCTAALFLYFFAPLTPRSSKEPPALKGQTSLRVEADRKLFTAFSDSFKHYKTSFFKVVAIAGETPWFLKNTEGPEVEWRFPLYWTQDHHKTNSSSYQKEMKDLSVDEGESAARLISFVDKYGIKSAAFYIKEAGKQSGSVSNPNAMELNPRFLSFTRPSKSKASKKQAVIEPKKKKAPTSTAPKPPTKKARVGDVATAPSIAKTPEISLPAEDLVLPSTTPLLTPTSAGTSVSHPPTVNKGKEVDPSGSACPPPLVTSSESRPGSFKRGQLWDGDIPEELGTAFFPPRRFLRSQPLEDEDRLEVQNVPRALCKAFGLSQAYLHLHGLYALASEEARNLKLLLERSDEKAKIFEAAKDAAEAEKEALSVELRDLRVTSEKTNDDLVATHRSLTQALADLLQATTDLDKAQTQQAEMHSSYSQSMDAVKSLQEQRSKLWAELEETRAALTEEKAAYENAADTIRQTASDSFDMALVQIEHLNPGVKLNLTGYGCRSCFKEGVLVPPSPSSEEESASLAEDDQEGNVGEARQDGAAP